MAAGPRTLHPCLPWQIATSWPVPVHQAVIAKGKGATDCDALVRQHGTRLCSRAAGSSRGLRSWVTACFGASTPSTQPVPCSLTAPASGRQLHQWLRSTSRQRCQPTAVGARHRLPPQHGAGQHGSRGRRRLCSCARSWGLLACSVSLLGSTCSHAAGVHTVPRAGLAFPWPHLPASAPASPGPALGRSLRGRAASPRGARPCRPCRPRGCRSLRAGWRSIGACAGLTQEGEPGAPQRPTCLSATSAA